MLHCDKCQYTLVYPFETDAGRPCPATFCKGNLFGPKPPQADVINHPPHYLTASGLECIDVIEAFGLGFRLGNTIKYILRAGKKGNRKEDLEKAKWYLEREIKAIP